MTDWMNHLSSWWMQLPPEWQLLVVLPFFVALVGLVAARARAPS